MTVTRVGAGFLLYLAASCVSSARRSTDAGGSLGNDAAGGSGGTATDREAGDEPATGQDGARADERGAAAGSGGAGSGVDASEAGGEVSAGSGGARADDGGETSGGGGASAGSGGASGGSGGASAGSGGAGAIDSAIDGGGGAGGDKETRKRIFHLKNGTQGQIRSTTDPRTGLEVADAQCAQAGQSYGTAQWKAWLSSSSVNALDRIADVGPWYRLDQETLLFASRAAMVNGPLAPISAQADTVDDRRNMFWSGTLADGTASANNCQDWTAYGGGNPVNIATVGRVDQSGSGWVDPTPLDCGVYLALLCIEQ